MQTSGEQSEVKRWSVAAGIARFSFKRWYFVFPVFVGLALASLAITATSLQKSLQPLGLATIEGSESETALELDRAFFQESLEASIFMFTNDEVPFENAAGQKNQEFVDEYDKAVDIIQTGAPDYIGTPLSPVQSDLVDDFISQDKHSILAQVPLYGSTSTESNLSLVENGLPQIQDAIDKAERETDMKIDFVSPTRLETALGEAAVQDAGESLLIAGVPVLLIALLAVGTLVGALLLFVVPFLSGPLMTLFLGLGAVTLLGQVVQINIFGVIALALISLALGGDFTIHVYYGYRRRVAQGEDRLDAIGGAAEVSGRASMIAAALAALAIIPVLFFPSTVLASFAWAAIVILVIQIVVIGFFVPAVIGMLGRSLTITKLPWHDPSSDPLNWRLSRPLSWSLGHPRTALFTAVVILGLCIVPVFSIFPITGSVSLVPDSLPAKQDAIAVQDTFVQGVPGATTIVVRSDNPMLDSLADADRAVEFQHKIENDDDTWFVAGPATIIDQFQDFIPDSLTVDTLMAGRQVLDDITGRNLGALVPVIAGGDISSLLGGGEQLSQEEQAQNKTQLTLDALDLAREGIPGVAAQLLAITHGDFIAIQAIPTVDPESPEALDWIKRIERYGSEVYGPFEEGDFVALGHAFPGGQVAQGLDVRQAIGRDLGKILGATALILFVLLTLVLRAPIAAFIVVVSQLAVVGASFGIMVTVFQWGWFGSSDQVGFIEAEIIVLMVPMLLALSTSFTVLLLFRVREEMGAPGPLVRSETLRAIMNSVRVGLAGMGLLFVIFFVFSLSDAILLAQLGVGLTAMVLLDVLVIRGLILPASIGLLGRRLWWIPFGLGLSTDSAAQIGERVDAPYEIDDTQSPDAPPSNVPAGPPTSPAGPSSGAPGSGRGADDDPPAAPGSWEQTGPTLDGGPFEPPPDTWPPAPPGPPRPPDEPPSR